jgi:leukotriene-A4 hydrolase
MPGIDPHSYVDRLQGEIVHIDLLICPNFSEKTLSVTAKYTFDRPLIGSLYLDVRDLDIHRIVHNGVDLEWEIDRQDDILGGRLHVHRLDRIRSFTIELTTSSKASALQWLAPSQTKGGRHPFLYSQCFPIHARSIFPCQDTPSARFTFNAELVVPTPLTGVLAAELLGIEKHHEKRHFHFNMPQPIPSYLFAFAVGEIAYRDLGPRFGIYAEPEILEAAAWEFAENEMRLSQGEKLFGRYVWDRYDVLVMPPSFPFGAMENPRLTFLSPVYVVGDRSGVFVIAHELAHAWTGNRVTNATWEDFWLNEGWTIYAETRITEVLESRDLSQLLASIGRKHMLMEIDRLGEDSMRTCLKFSQKGIDPDEAVTIIPYEKGYAFLIQLERAVGREAFNEFIQKYISRFSFKALTTENYVQFLTEELPSAVEKVDLEEWLYRPGFPKNAHPLRSKLYDEVEELVSAFKNGQLPSKEWLSHWIPHQVILFIQMFPKKISIEECRHIESLFEFKGSSHYASLTFFFTLCIRSGYQDVLPEIEHFLGTVGISSRLVLIYRALVNTEWSRGQARPYFERYRERYHPITAANIERALSEAGV